MLCPSCGAFMPLHQAFCTQCGTGLSDAPPSVPAGASARPAPARCTFPGCPSPISKPGHTLCYTHWKATARPSTSLPAPLPQADSLLTATTLGERLNLPSRKVNSVLAELGWISKDGNGWVATAQALALGAKQKRAPQNGTPFVVWPSTILTNTALHATVSSIQGDSTETPAAAAAPERSFRDRFPAQHRTTDGHWVRSKAELLIDNWLYMAGIVHAYERRLPIEEETYCDFYIPAGKVYIEYWGLEHDPAYAVRQQVKQALYRRYQLHLIEVTDDHVRNLDDCLPKLLLTYGVAVS